MVAVCGLRKESRVISGPADRTADFDGTTLQFFMLRAFVGSTGFGSLFLGIMW